MNFEQLLNIVACIVLIVFGVYSIVQPEAAATMAHLHTKDATGQAEIRTAFGGMSIGLGAAPLIFYQPVGFQVAGLIWLIVFATRLIATYLDHPKLERTFIISGVFELIIGIILLT